MATAETYITDALARAGDTSSNRWTRAEMLSYLNYGIRDYARKSQAFRKVRNLASNYYGAIKSPERFPLPSDLLEVLYVEYQNKVLEGTSWRDLAEANSQFVTDSGTPTKWYQDLSNSMEIRLYPIPDANIGAWATPNQENGMVVALSIDGTAATFSSEFGMAIDIVDSSGDLVFLFSDEVGAESRKNEYIIPIINRREVGDITSILTPDIRVAYAYTPADLEMEDDTPDFPDYHKEALIFFMLLRAYQKDGPTRDLQKAEYFESKYNQLAEDARVKMRMVNALRERSVTGSYY